MNRTVKCTWCGVLFLFKKKLHRKNGPAVITPSTYKSWWKNGKRHRKDGPAIISSDGTKEWWVNGNKKSSD